MKWKHRLSSGDSESESGSSSNNVIPHIIMNNIDSGEGQHSPSIRVFENNIFFYGDVNDQNALELNQALIAIDTHIRQSAVLAGPEFTPPINLRINSPGGSVFAGLAVVDTIRSLKSPVHTYIEGYAASAATIISVVGKKRFIGKYSMMLIHQISSGTYGKLTELEDWMDSNQLIMKVIKDIYKQYTKFPMKQLDEALKKDILMDANKCLELGIVDQII